MKHRILIVEDDPDKRKQLVDEAIESSGCKISFAEDEKEAIPLLQKFLFSVVVTDIDLSKARGTREGGFKVLEAARDRDPSTQVIVTTVRPLKQYKRFVHAHGGFSYVDLAMHAGWDLLLIEIRDALDRFEEEQERKPSLRMAVSDDLSSVSYRVTPRMQHFLNSDGVRSKSGVELWKACSTAVGSLLVFGFPALIQAPCRLMGESLWAALFKTNQDLLLAYGETRGLAARTFHVPIQASTERDLLDVPLELLHDGDEYLALRHPFTRVINGVHHLGRTWKAVLDDCKDGMPLRVLLIAANTWGRMPGPELIGVDPIPNVEKEIDGIEIAIRNAKGNAFPNIDLSIVRSWEATHDMVLEKLQESWDVVHYAGHGAFHDGTPNLSKIILWDKACTSKQWQAVVAGSIASTMLGQLRSLNTNDLTQAMLSHPPSLFYLNCCHSGRTGSSGQLVSNKSLGLMDAITRIGVPIVIGHRWPLIDSDASLLFVTTFYHHLMREYSPEEAMFKARKIVEDHDEIWGSSVLIQQA